MSLLTLQHFFTLNGTLTVPLHNETSQIGRPSCIDTIDIVPPFSAFTIIPLLIAVFFFFSESNVWVTAY